MLTVFTPFVQSELFDDKGMLMAVITVSGIVIVFSILVLLIFIFYAYGAIFRIFTQSSEPKKAEAPKQSVPVQAPAAATSQPLSDGEIPGEIIAVIAAAVASLDDGKTYRVKKVSRARTPVAGRTAWAASGLFENTRPF